MRSLRAPVRVVYPAAAALLIVSLLGSLSCSDPGTPLDGLVPAPSLSFMLSDSTAISFTGQAAWPPSGQGVIARMDSAGTTLQIAGYRQTAGKAPDLSGPEQRFDILFLEIRDSSGIEAGTYTPSAALFGRDLAIAGLDSLGYAATSGSITLGSATSTRVGGTFSFTAMRSTDSATVGILQGRFDAPWGAPLFMDLTEDSGGEAGGSIQVLADTGTTPGYFWTGGPAYAVGVARAGTPSSLVWGVVTEFGDSIATGLRHGQVPAGAFSVAGAETVLTRGIAYRVTVSRVGGAYGWRVFTP